MGRVPARTPTKHFLGLRQGTRIAPLGASAALVRTGTLFTLSALSALLSFGPTTLIAREETGTVTRVVDGNTIEVSISGKVEKVRLIGVATPEIVDSRHSEFTKQLVEGKTVVLRDELGGQDRDTYGRLLRYLYLEDGSFVNAEIIKQGYGHAYAKYPFSHMEEFLLYERQAREKGLGLWGSREKQVGPEQARAPTVELYVGSSESNKYHRPERVWAQKISLTNLITFESPEGAQARGYVRCKICNPPFTSGKAEAAQNQSLTSPSSAAAAESEELVYVTRTGMKYHRAGCRYLSKSMIPMPLREAAQSYAPCGVCRPPVPKN